MRFHPEISPLFGLLLVAACASTPAAKPQDASAAQHDEAASAHEREARIHSGEYKPEGAPKCDWVQGTAYVSCWTPTNPTTKHKDIAEAHKRAAAEHRAASKALRDAEDLTCAGIDAEDRDVSPFAHTADIVRVEALHTEKDKVVREEGALVEFRPVSGLTPSILQRIVDCHLARDAALGHDVPELSYCPLVPKGVTATVRWKDDKSSGLLVEIRAKDDATAHEVWRRVSALHPQ